MGRIEVYSETIIRNPITLRLCHYQQLPLADLTLSENRIKMHDRSEHMLNLNVFEVRSRVRQFVGR